MTPGNPTLGQPHHLAGPQLLDLTEERPRSRHVTKVKELRDHLRIDIPWPTVKRTQFRRETDEVVAVVEIQWLLARTVSGQVQCALVVTPDRHGKHPVDLRKQLGTTTLECLE